MPYGFIETREQTLIRESTEEFAKKEIENKIVPFNENGEFAEAIIRKMGAQGYLGIMAPKRYGGLGLGYLSYVFIVETLARHDSSCAGTVAAHNSLGVGPILYFGTAEQKRRILPPLCQGEGLWAFGQTEPSAGSDVQSIKTHAEFDAQKEEWVLNGSKVFITNGSSPMTHGITILAVTGENGNRKEFTTFLVPAGTPGLDPRPMHRKGVWRSSDTAEVFLDNVRIPDKNRLGERGQGFRIMMFTLDRGRMPIGGMGAGIADRALELAIQYAKQREQFGMPIAEHQALAFKMAEMEARLSAAKLLLYRACWLCQNKMPFEKEAAKAKFICSQVAEYCVRESSQIHGGPGLMEESLIWRLLLDTNLLRVGEGTDEMQLLVIARRMGLYDRA